MIHVLSFRVDYVDSFGRSRKCLRQDLPIMQQKDTKIKENPDTRFKLHNV